MSWWSKSRKPYVAWQIFSHIHVYINFMIPQVWSISTHIWAKILKNVFYHFLQSWANSIIVWKASFAHCHLKLKHMSQAQLPNPCSISLVLYRNASRIATSLETPKFRKAKGPVRTTDAKMTVELSDRAFTVCLTVTFAVGMFVGYKLKSYRMRYLKAKRDFYAQRLNETRKQMDIASSTWCSVCVCIIAPRHAFLWNNTSHTKAGQYISSLCMMKTFCCDWKTGTLQTLQTPYTYLGWKLGTADLDIIIGMFFCLSVIGANTSYHVEITTSKWSDKSD